MSLSVFLDEVAISMVSVTRSSATSFTPEIDTVKLTALIDALSALESAISAAEEAKGLDPAEDKAYLREVCHNYAKAQVDIQMNLSAIGFDWGNAA